MSDTNDKSTSGIEQIESSQPQGTCEVCGRAIAKVSDECADCLSDDGPATLADFGGDRDV